jgi:hypothetical protein
MNCQSSDERVELSFQPCDGPILFQLDESVIELTPASSVSKLVTRQGRVPHGENILLTRLGIKPIFALF